MKRSLVFMLWIAAGPAMAADATVQWARRIELGLGVSGVIKTVSAEAGARVAKGQVLVALDETPFKAAFDKARTERDEAVRDYKQARELYDRTVLAKVELENAQNKSVRAQARFEEAKYQLERSRIAAPFDAWVLEMRVQAGQSVVNALESRPLVVVAAAGEYLARLRVPSATVDRLKLGQSVNVSVGGKSYAGRIHALALEAAGGKSDGQHDVAVLFQAPEMLRPGRAAVVELP
ncbi:MAG: HlyD family efflux transporter periplasmic adaptor subunit [Pseudomonadota bacterium]